MQEITLSQRTNKLEQDPYYYRLQSVEKPELFREMFPYTQTPKIAFIVNDINIFYLLFRYPLVK